MEQNEQPDPLDCLPEKEAYVMEGVLTIIHASISDEKLRDKLIAQILAEIEEWGDSVADEDEEGEPH